MKCMDAVLLCVYFVKLISYIVYFLFFFGHQLNVNNCKIHTVLSVT